MNIRLSLMVCMVAWSAPRLVAGEDQQVISTAEQRLQEIDFSLARRQYEHVQMQLFETSLKLDLLPVDGDSAEEIRHRQKESLQSRIEILRARADSLREMARMAAKGGKLPEKAARVASPQRLEEGQAAREEGAPPDCHDAPDLANVLAGTLPNGARIVAAGLLIDWTSPEPGTAILVEVHSGRAIKSQSVSPETPFRIDPSETESIRLLNALFADPDEIKDEDRLAPLPGTARFVLYFAPEREH